MTEDFERIRASLETIEAPALRDACALLLSEEKNPVSQSASANVGRWDDFDRVESFADLIQMIKRKFEFQELGCLSVEGGTVFAEIGGRKQELAMDSRAAAPSRSEAPPLPRRETEARARPAGPKPAQSASGRFGNLEIDS